MNKKQIKALGATPQNPVWVARKLSDYGDHPEHGRCSKVLLVAPCSVTDPGKYGHRNGVFRPDGGPDHLCAYESVPYLRDERGEYIRDENGHVQKGELQWCPSVVKSREIVCTWEEYEAGVAKQKGRQDQSRRIQKEQNKRRRAQVRELMETLHAGAFFSSYDDPAKQRAYQYRINDQWIVEHGSRYDNHEADKVTLKLKGYGAQLEISISRLGTETVAAMIKAVIRAHREKHTEGHVDPANYNTCREFIEEQDNLLDAGLDAAIKDLNGEEE